MATAYKSKFTGEQIDNSVETVVSNTATDGQVLTANGTGGASWQDVKGTEVVANPVLAGTESDLTGLEVAGTKYKVPTGGGTEVVANPSLAGTESYLTGLEVAGTKYKVPSGGGTEVVANPVLAGTESDLTGLEVAGTKYKVPTGGTQLYRHKILVFNSNDEIVADFVCITSSNNNYNLSNFITYCDLTTIGITGTYRKIDTDSYFVALFIKGRVQDNNLTISYVNGQKIETFIFDSSCYIADTVTPL